MSDSLRPHGLNSPWNSPGQNTGVDSLSLLQGIFPTQRSNPGLPHCRQILYQLSNKGRPKRPKILEWVAYLFFRGSFLPGIKLGSPALQVDSLPAKPQRNATQNYGEASPHSSQNGHHQKVYKQLMLERVWREGSFLSQLVGM